MQLRIKVWVIALLIGMLGASPIQAEIIQVANTNDSGVGSLRQAILTANSVVGADRIEFAIPGDGPHIIAPLSALPALTQGVEINGYTQERSFPNTLADGDDAVLGIWLSGSNLSGFSIGVKIEASNCVVRGLCISDFGTNTAGGYGIDIGNGATGTKIEGCFIGTDLSGLSARANSFGIRVSNAQSSTIGGTSPAQRNLISGNAGFGIFLDGPAAARNVVVGNFIGTDVQGTSRLSNGNRGVYISGPDNRVGGTVPGARNVISGSGQPNLEIDGSFLQADSTGNVVQGNFIGTNAAGTAALSNSSNGIQLSNSRNNTIGGSEPGAGNVVAGSALVGIAVFNSSRITIQGNRIGTDVTGTTALPNTLSGIEVQNSPDVLVGGTTEGAGNLISGNIRSGVLISYSSSNSVIVQGNRIGTDASGTLKLGNGNSGIRIENGASNSLLGGTVAGARNIISGNTGYGIAIDSATHFSGRNTIQGNFIGTDITGAQALGNTLAGVLIASSPDNQVGGVVPGAGNVISANNRGVEIQNIRATGNVVQGNLIGTDASGARALGNILDGVQVGASVANLIGGSAPGARNTIAGNGRHGVYAYAPSDATVQGNWIGFAADGSGFLPNEGHGVLLEGTVGAFVGGDQPGQGNLIAGNTLSGVTVTGVRAARNRIQRNSIFANGTRGIDLIGGDANDPGDVDSGPNELQNHPEIQRAASYSSAVAITGRLSSAPSSSFTVEFFSSEAASAAQGRVFIGAQEVSTDANGSASFTASFPVSVPRGRLVTATATDSAGNTSEFSSPVEATTPGVVQFSAARFSIGEGGSIATVSATRTGGADGVVSVGYGTSDGSATAGADYQSTSGTLTWGAGDTTPKAFTVPIVEDALDEVDETLNLGLSAFTGGAGAGTLANAIATIADNDDAPRLSISDAAAVEGNSGTTAVTFRVTLSAASGKVVTVRYATADGTARSGTDYQSTSGNLAFLPGETIKEVTTAINGDLISEGDERFWVQLSLPDNVFFLNGSGSATIQDDDVASLSLSVAPTLLAEGAAALGTVTRNTPVENALVVGFSPSDLAVTVPTSVTIPAGATATTFQVTALDDNVARGMRSVTISAASAGFPVVMAQVSVADNDGPTLFLRIDPLSVSEAGGSAAATGRLRRNTLLGDALTVSLVSSDPGTLQVPTTLTLPAGIEEVSFSVGAVDELRADGSRAATVIASAESFNPGIATVTVTDNDTPRLTLSLSRSTLMEGARVEGARAVGTVTRNFGVSQRGVLALSSSDASEARVPASVVIPAGAASASFIVVAQDDLFADGPQQVTITGSASGVAPASARLSVLDNERPTLTLAIAPGRVSENERTTATVILSRNSEITALTPALRVGLSASLTRQLRMPISVVIPARAASARFTVTGVNNLLATGPRQVLVTASATGFASGRASVIVTDDEAASNGVISGRVLLATRLLAGVRGVLATLRRGSAVLDVALSDATGNFRFVGLPAGLYTISVEAVGSSFAPAARLVLLSVPSRGVPTASVSFTAVPRAVITSFSPGFGLVGSTVTINGMNFERASSVKFGAISARFTLVSSSVIRATVPPNARAGDSYELGRLRPVSFVARLVASGL